MHKVTQNLTDRRKLWQKPLSQHTHTQRETHWKDQLRAALLCHMSSCGWVKLWKRTRLSWCGVWGYVQCSNLIVKTHIKSCLTSATCHTEMCSAAWTRAFALKMLSVNCHYPVMRNKHTSITTINALRPSVRRSALVYHFQTFHSRTCLVFQKHAVQQQNCSV